MNDALLVVVVVVALAFDFTNGFHDTANYVATWVGTRALSPRMAVADLRRREPRRRVRHDGGREDRRRGNHRQTASRPSRRCSPRLLGAIVWNLFTWRLGLPSSSTHALIGGLVGAALVQSGASGVQWHGIWDKVIIPGAVSPVIGFAGAFLVIVHRLPGLLPGRRRASRTAASATGSSSRARGSRSRTARTTRRRRWA